MKYFFVVICLVLINYASYAQTNQEKAKALCLEAETLYNKEQYQQSLDKLSEVVPLLGSLNSNFLNLAIKNSYALKKYDGTKLLIEAYLELNPANDRDFKEIIRIKDELCAQKKLVPTESIINYNLISDYLMESKGVYERLENYQSEISKTLEKMSDELNKLYREFLEGSNILSESQKNVKQREFESLQIKYANYEESSLKDFEIYRDKQIKPIVSEIYQLLSQEGLPYTIKQYDGLQFIYSNTVYNDVTNKILSKISANDVEGYSVNAIPSSKNIAIFKADTVLRKMYEIYDGEKELNTYLSKLEEEFDVLFNRFNQINNELQSTNISEQKKMELMSEQTKLMNQYNEFKENYNNQASKKYNEIIISYIPDLKKIIEVKAQLNCYVMVMDYSDFFDTRIVYNNTSGTYPGGIVTDITPSLLRKINE